jgi:hypothetical protein
MGLDIYFYKQNKMNPEREEALKNYNEAGEALNDFWMKNPEFDPAAHGGSIREEHDELEKTYKVCKSVYNTLMEREEVAYFRKVNLLLPFFGYNENCAYLTITKDQVEDLIGTCSNVLAKEVDIRSRRNERKCAKQNVQQVKAEWNEKNVQRIQKQIELIDQEWIDYCQETLPNQEGFFFGDYEYDEWYIDKVQSVMKTFEEVIENVDWERQDLIMYCWW